MCVGFVPSYCCAYSWVLYEVERFIVYSFCIPVPCSWQIVLLGFTFNWYVHYLHVVVGLLFRKLVARKTHSYYVVELDVCVSVLGSAQTVVGSLFVTHAQRDGINKI